MSHREDPACSNGVDDDGDGAIDFPEDIGCEAAWMRIENPACNDGLDNDFDSQSDLLDPHCDGIAWKRSESPALCGLGFEIAALLPLLARLRCASRARARYRA